MIMYNGQLFLPMTMMCILDATYYTQECVPARTYLLNHDHLSPLILQSLFLRMQNPAEEEEEECMVQREREREEKRREEEEEGQEKRKKGEGRGSAEESRGEDESK